MHVLVVPIVIGLLLWGLYLIAKPRAHKDS